VVDVNFFGTKNLIDACNVLDYDCFVNTGSSSEYGIKNSPMNEDDVCVPVNMYGVTKNMATKYCQMIAKTHDKPIIGFRIFSPYGSFDHKDRLMSYVIVNALQDKDIILNNPYGVRDYIFIDDVVDLYLLAIRKARENKGEIFNIGSGKQQHIQNVAEKVINLCNSKSKIVIGEYKPRAYDNKIWVADMNKTKQVFDWKPKYDIREGLKKTINWYKENLEKYE